MNHSGVIIPMPFVIKEEVLSDSDEEVYCRLCHKGFASPVALRNHASMDHMEAFGTGDPSVWTKSVDETMVKTKKKQRFRSHDIVSSMAPTALTSLAGTDVSYIIVKTEDPLEDKKQSKRESKKIHVHKKAKSVEAITGPFECLEPSPLGADGVCHQIFFSCCAYSSHARNEHARRRRAPRCQVCERTLPAKRVEPGAPPYACETCNATFQTDLELETHMATEHVKAKPYACGVCHKRFTQQGGVLQHMRMHTGERPFACGVCNKAFTQKSGLDQHTRTHTKLKPYRCVVCSKTFIQSVHLKQHMRTHTNVAPFQCGICEKRFKQSSHLNYHLKNHNPANMTDEQRRKYELLVGQIASDGSDYEMYSGAGQVEVEIAESGQEAYYIQTEDGIMDYQP